MWIFYLLLWIIVFSINLILLFLDKSNCNLSFIFFYYIQFLIKIRNVLWLISSTAYISCNNHCLNRIRSTYCEIIPRPNSQFPFFYISLTPISYKAFHLMRVSSLFWWVIDSIPFYLFQFFIFWMYEKMRAIFFSQN